MFPINWQFNWGSSLHSYSILLARILPSILDVIYLMHDVRRHTMSACLPSCDVQNDPCVPMTSALSLHPKEPPIFHLKIYNHWWALPIALISLRAAKRWFSHFTIPSTFISISIWSPRNTVQVWRQDKCLVLSLYLATFRVMTWGPLATAGSDQWDFFLNYH